MPGKFSPSLMSRHAVREAGPSIRPSEDDDLREIRTRWFAEEGIEVVVDVYDGRVVTVWRKGRKT